MSTSPDQRSSSTDLALDSEAAGTDRPSPDLARPHRPRWASQVGDSRQARRGTAGVYIAAGWVRTRMVPRLVIADGPTDEKGLSCATRSNRIARARPALSIADVMRAKRSTGLWAQEARPR